MHRTRSRGRTKFRGALGGLGMHFGRSIIHHRGCHLGCPPFLNMRPFYTIPFHLSINLRNFLKRPANFFAPCARAAVSCPASVRICRFLHGKMQKEMWGTRKPLQPVSPEGPAAQEAEAQRGRKHAPFGHALSPPAAQRVLHKAQAGCASAPRCAGRRPYACASARG